MNDNDVEAGLVGGSTAKTLQRRCCCNFVKCNWRINTSVSCIYNCCVVTLGVICVVVLIFVCKDYAAIVLFWLERQEHWTIYLIYVGLFTVVSFPFMWGYTFLVISAGYLFGILRGITTVIISANIGVAIAHLLMRRFYTKLPLSNMILNNEKVTAILNVISGQNAFRVAAIARVTPIPFGLQNIIFAVSSINTREYFVASFFGLLPAQLIHAHIGSSLRSMEDVLSNKSTAATGLVILLQITVLVAMLVYIIGRARRQLNKTLAIAPQTRIY